MDTSTTRVICPDCGKAVRAKPLDGGDYRMNAHNRPVDCEHRGGQTCEHNPIVRADYVRHPAGPGRYYGSSEILGRLSRSWDPFVIELGPDDSAWDPETGDTLLGGVRITYARGTFPGPSLTATIAGGSPMDPQLTGPDGENVEVTDEHRETAAELLPWAPTDEDGLAYRQQQIAQAIANAEARGARNGYADGQRDSRHDTLVEVRDLIDGARCGLADPSLRMAWGRKRRDLIDEVNA